jgi:hypothetical protein
MKIELMKELLDRYEQLKFINDECTLIIVKTYIQEKEWELIKVLWDGLFDKGERKK